MAWTNEKIIEITDQIKERSKTDKAFRDTVLSDPNKVIKELSGLDVPENCILRFVEQKPENTVVILPAYEGDELADDNLEQVAGGFGNRGFKYGPGGIYGPRGPYGR